MAPAAFLYPDAMNLFGFEITRRGSMPATRNVARAAPPAAVTTSAHGSSWPFTVREPYTGAWQNNDEQAVDNVVSYTPVFACITLIASDVSKCKLGLVAVDDEGIWSPVDKNVPWNPVLRKPNRYQTIQRFVETWMISKLTHGNAYVLKARDQRGIVTGMYVLDPTRVTPMVATDGSVFYEIQRDDLANVGVESGPLVVPASEIIHDRMNCLFHPLIGVSPIFACGVAALQGMKIQNSSSRFFGNGARPSGILTAPGAVAPETLQRLKEYWNTNFTGENAGRVAVVGDGLKFEAMAQNAVDSQLIEQLQWTASQVASAFRVPIFMIDASKSPPYANAEPLVQQYYSQCLQSYFVSLETALDEGLELPAPYGTEFDIDDLIWMDNGTRTKAAHESIQAGALSPDEARKKYFGLGSVDGGDTPYLQQQMFSLRALAERDADSPFSKPQPAPQQAPPQQTPPPNDDDAIGDIPAAKLYSAWMVKTARGDLYAR